MGAGHSSHSGRPDWAASAQQQAEAEAIARAQAAYQRAARKDACGEVCQEARRAEYQAMVAQQAAMREAEEARQQFEAEQAEAARRAQAAHEEAERQIRERASRVGSMCCSRGSRGTLWRRRCWMMSNCSQISGHSSEILVMIL